MDSDVSGLVFWDVTLCGWVIPTFRDCSSDVTVVGPGTGLLGCDTGWVRIPTFRDWSSVCDVMSGEDSDVSGLVLLDVTLCRWVIPTFREWSSWM